MDETLFLCRYDVEQFQKIEALIGQRMEKFEHEEEAALLLYERVTEAQKLATMQMKEADKGRSGKRKGRGDTAADDADPLQEAGGKRYFKKKY